MQKKVPSPHTDAIFWWVGRRLSSVFFSKLVIFFGSSYWGEALAGVAAKKGAGELSLATTVRGDVFFGDYQGIILMSCIEHNDHHLPVSSTEGLPCELYFL